MLPPIGIWLELSKSHLQIYFCSVLHCPTLPYTVIHVQTRSYTVLNYPTLPFCVIHCPTLSYTVIYCPKLSYTTATVQFLLLNTSMPLTSNIRLGKKGNTIASSLRHSLRLQNVLQLRSRWVSKKPHKLPPFSVGGALSQKRSLCFRLALVVKAHHLYL